MRKRIAVLLVGFMLTFGFVNIVSTPAASANAACPNLTICFYPCYLAESCGYWQSVVYSQGTCVATGAGGFTNLTYSVKNRRPGTYYVYHTTNCTGVNAPLYGNTSGNMNGDWAGAGIKSVKRIS